jgi:hypothetical protein
MFGFYSADSLTAEVVLMKANNQINEQLTQEIV